MKKSDHQELSVEDQAFIEMNRRSFQ